MAIKSTKKQLIFDRTDLFGNCHASTLVALGNGDLLSAWFAGTEEGAPDVDIWGSRYQSGKWTKPLKIAGEDGLPHWNPVLFADGKGELYLFYKTGHRIPTWTTRVTRSGDGGFTWLVPRELVRGDIGGRGPVKNKPIILSNGWWIAPASIEGQAWDAFVDISKDCGESWDASELITLRERIGKGVIQPSLWESSPGRVHMFLRSTAGFLYRSDSEDFGLTWCPAYVTDIPNNNSGIDVVRTSHGTLVLVSNPVSGDWAARTPLTVSFSRDNGFTWGNDVLTLDDEPGEYSYPAIISSSAHVYITYTWKRESIAFWDIELDE